MKMRIIHREVRRYSNSRIRLTHFRLVLSQKKIFWNQTKKADGKRSVNQKSCLLLKAPPLNYKTCPHHSDLWERTRIQIKRRIRITLYYINDWDNSPDHQSRNMQWTVWSAIVLSSVSIENRLWDRILWLRTSLRFLFLISLCFRDTVEEWL